MSQDQKSFINPNSQGASVRLDRLEEVLMRLKAQLTAVTTNSLRRTPNRRPTSSVSHTRRPQSPSSVCWYHQQFGGAARRCLQPCSFKTSLTASGRQSHATVESTAAGSVANLHTRRLFLWDRIAGAKFLVDSGAEVSVVPPTPAERKHRSSFCLTAANNSSIPTFGQRSITPDLGLRRIFRWVFIIADVSVALIVLAEFSRWQHNNVWRSDQLNFKRRQRRKSSSSSKSASEKEIDSLCQLFPQICRDELADHLRVAAGDVSSAVDRILAGNPTNRQSSPPPLDGNHNDVDLPRMTPEERLATMERYGMVDVSSSQTIHRPRLPTAVEGQQESRIRYLNNEVVDTTGKRYIEIKQDYPNMPKPVYLKAARKYRFH
nr:unnamed protein product [Spirometra erinaceieuropaei]